MWPRHTRGLHGNPGLTVCLPHTVVRYTIRYLGIVLPACLIRIVMHGLCVPPACLIRIVVHGLCGLQERQDEEVAKALQEETMPVPIPLPAAWTEVPAPHHQRRAHHQQQGSGGWGGGGGGGVPRSPAASQVCPPALRAPRMLLSIAVLVALSHSIGCARVTLHGHPRRHCVSRVTSPVSSKDRAMSMQ